MPAKVAKPGLARATASQRANSIARKAVQVGKQERAVPEEGALFFRTFHIRGGVLKTTTGLAKGPWGPSSFSAASAFLASSSSLWHYAVLANLFFSRFILPHSER